MLPKDESVLLNQAASSGPDAKLDTFPNSGHAANQAGNTEQGATLGGKHCPPRAIWAGLAAGVEIEGAENFLNHAVHCEHCGQLLLLASAELSDELTPEEEARIAALSSSAADWQAQLAATLQAAHPEATAPAVFSPRWFATAMAAVTPAGAALAAVLLAAVVLAVQDYQLQDKVVEQADLAERSSRTAAELRRLQPDAGEQHAQVAQLTTEQTASAPRSESQSDGPRPVPERIAALTLESGLTRGSGQTARLSIPAGADAVKVVLHAPAGAGLAGHQIREELMTVDRQPIWSLKLRPSAAETSSGRLSMLIPAYLLTPDDYLIVLSHESQNGPEEVATYTFRVPR